MALTYVKPEQINLKTSTEFNEKWVQEIIANDPSILGLGDLVLKDKERIQPRAGRLDLLMQDSEAPKRYEIEIQLGRTDESHIIRTLEYWDIERKRYPQYEHVAVIVAEEITSRFLNVISLFNGSIPLIAIQMSAIRQGENISLIFTKVLDEVRLGLEEEDEDTHEVTDRNYWETKANKKTLELVDEMLLLIKTFDGEISLKYNKFYIGLTKNNNPINFVIFRPKKDYVRLEPRLPKADALQNQIEEQGLDLMDYDIRWSRYRMRIVKADLDKHKEFLTELMMRAYEED